MGTADTTSTSFPLERCVSSPAVGRCFCRRGRCVGLPARRGSLTACHDLRTVQGLDRRANDFWRANYKSRVMVGVPLVEQMISLFSLLSWACLVLEGNAEGDVTDTLCYRGTSPSEVK